MGRARRAVWFLHETDNYLKICDAKVRIITESAKSE